MKKYLVNGSYAEDAGDRKLYGFQNKAKEGSRYWLRVEFREYTRVDYNVSRLCRGLLASVLNYCITEFSRLLALRDYYLDF
ncbi:hypothetical protein ACTXT7_007614 [Hymenolepis weldensis]